MRFYNMPLTGSAFKASAASSALIKMEEKQMGLSDILVLDFDPDSCPVDHCGQIAKLLPKLLPDSEIVTQTGFTAPSAVTTSFSPALILLKSCLTENFHPAIQALKEKWRVDSVLGIFCANSRKADAVCQAITEDLEDFLFCPFEEIELLLRVRRLLQAKGGITTDLPPMQLKAPSRFEGLVGQSKLFLQIIEKIPSIARSDATVLIAGETGTGKEIVARAIHYQSPRHAKPFVPVNCGALPDHLIENELFGHVQGAYTGASSSETGLLAEAEGGTLFLDEVDALSSSAQVKLLRFLQDREYRPLGSSRSCTADVRIIAATSANLLKQVQLKQFRSDLYYRLHVVTLHLPRLCERLEDIPLLANHFLRQHGHDNSRLSQGCLPKLVDYDWPGNIRELEGVIQRGIVMTSSPTLQPKDIELPGSNHGNRSGDESFSHAKTRAIEQFERSYLINVLAMHKGNITRAAKSAGKERRSFQRLLHKHGLNRRTFQA